MRASQGSWVVAPVLALAASVTISASLPAQDGDNMAAAPNAAALAQFYATPLATSPIGVTEDADVWLAKVRGLVANAPGWLQRSALASRSKLEFTANLSLLERVQKGSFEQAVAAAKSRAVDDRMKAMAVKPNLGEEGGDLTYTALEPCRIMDSRLAAAGSGLTNPLVGNVLYQMDTSTLGAGNWSKYGGNPTSDCGLDVGGPMFSGIAIVITILNPNFDSYLGAADMQTLSAVLDNVALNFTHGQGLSSLYIVTFTISNVLFFAMPPGLSANIIFDVIGYFTASSATALNCQVQNGTPISISAFTLTGVTSPVCAPRYALSGGNCKGSGGDIESLRVITSSAQTTAPGSASTTS